MNFISPDTKQYRANLHCHSTLSDGSLPPEELIRAYREAGYSILAITDHEATCDHSAASGPDFLMLTGYEVYIRPSPDYVIDRYGPEVHLNLLAKEPHNTTLIAYDSRACKYMSPEAAALRKKAGNLGPRRYSREYVQAVIDAARENGYLVTYNHPGWSQEEPEDVMAYDGYFSLEIFNTGSMRSNGLENNQALYDRMLRKGKFVYCHGADDNHNHRPFGTPLCDSFGSWTMVLAEELTYPAVIRALEEGRFYASTGPTITCLRFDGDKVHVECSPALRVVMHMTAKWTANVCHDDWSPVTQADFQIPENVPYVYFSVLTADGKEACTHAFTRAELGI